MVLAGILASCSPPSPTAAPARPAPVATQRASATSVAPTAQPASAECEVAVADGTSPSELTEQQVLSALFRGYVAAKSEIRLFDGRVVDCNGKPLSTPMEYPSLVVSEDGRALLEGELVVATRYFGDCVVAVLGIADRRVVVRDRISTVCITRVCSPKRASAEPRPGTAIRRCARQRSAG